MAKQVIDNTGTTDTLASGMGKANSNFTELYNLVAALGSPLKVPNALDASGNANYPAGTAGDTYKITVAGKVGGASGKVCEIGDMLICFVTNAGGTEAGVGADWYVVQANIVGMTAAGLAVLTGADAAAQRTSLGLGSAATHDAGDFTLTDPRVLYIHTDGNDTAGDGSPGKPYATAQKGYDVALAGSGNYVLRFGVGSFGGVTVNSTAGWPARITLAGANARTSFVGGLTVTGTAGNAGSTGTTDPPDGSAGSAGGAPGDLVIVGDGNINVGDVVSTGGAGGAGGAGGTPLSFTSGATGGGGGTGGAGGKIVLVALAVASAQSVGQTGGTGGTGGAGGSDGMTNEPTGNGGAGANGGVSGLLILQNCECLGNGLIGGTPGAGGTGGASPAGPGAGGTPGADGSAGATPGAASNVIRSSVVDATLGADIALNLCVYKTLGSATSNGSINDTTL